MPVASKQVQSARRRASGAAFFLAIVKWRERSSSGRRGELAVCRSRRRHALVAQKDFLQKATKETKLERPGPLTADHRPPAVACAKAADEKVDLLVSRLRFVVLLFIRVMRG